MKRLLLTSMSFSLLLGCSSSEITSHDDIVQEMYFPPISGSEWETSSVESLGWEQSQIPQLLEFLEQKNTKSFIVLVDGRIVMEHYFDGHSASLPWYWASAGKTLTTAVVGIAQNEGILIINNRVSDYLGTGWTSAPLNKENLILNRHLLAMTSGLDDSLGDEVSPEHLQYVADAGTRWAYHNVYVKLQDVVSQASGESWTSYFNSRLRDRIGMTGSWTATGETGDLSVYFSTARSMARFGLLMLNSGKWADDQVIPADYLANASTTSQPINKSYGYLWWINGESSYHLPQTQFEFQGSIIPSGPTDMYMALGKNDQKLYVVPSKNMVVVRMGNSADDVNVALSDFDENLWEKLANIIP